MTIKCQWLNQKLILATVLMAIVVGTAIMLKDRTIDSSKVELTEKAAPTTMGSSLPKPSRLAKSKSDRNIPDGAFMEIAIKDLEKVKALRENSKQDSFFDSETLALAQDVMNAAGRVSYFPAKRALIAQLKAEKNASKIEDLILNYDKLNTDFSETPVLAHFSFIALGELSREEGIERGASIYEALTRRLSALEGDKSSHKIQVARLTDIYDLTRNIIRNQIGNQEAEWSEIAGVLDQLKVREHFLSPQMKQELKKAIASVSKLETISNLDDLHAQLDAWWD